MFFFPEKLVSYANFPFEDKSSPEVIRQNLRESRQTESTDYTDFKRQYSPVNLFLKNPLPCTTTAGFIVVHLFSR